MNTEQVTSFQPACRRRDSLLASIGATPVVSTSTESSSLGTISSDSHVATPTSTNPIDTQPAPTTPSPAAPQSASQAVAAAVLGSRSPTANPSFEHEIAAAVAAGRGVPGNPIVVELSESKSSLVVSVSCDNP